MEGRDIGSKIFPDADLRFFLFADPEERARRREQQGLHDHVAKRDTLDQQRLSESLRGATVIDSTHLSLDQVVEQMSAAIAARMSRAGVPRRVMDAASGSTAATSSRSSGETS